MPVTVANAERPPMAGVFWSQRLGNTFRQPAPDIVADRSGSCLPGVGEFHRTHSDSASLCTAIVRIRTAPAVWRRPWARIAGKSKNRQGDPATAFSILPLCRWRTRVRHCAWQWPAKSLQPARRDPARQAGQAPRGRECPAAGNTRQSAAMNRDRPASS